MIAPLACPRCRAALAELRCRQCGREYDVVDEVPILLADVTPAAEQQAAFFDHVVDDEFEIERPAGTPAFFRWLLEEKFRRAVAGTPVRGRSVLVVCGGSGMDAEFLVRAGARVASSDISLGAARRTLERARRHDVSMAALVADAEHLPFEDRSVDIAYVHDGLHHLERPLAALEEMARVASIAVCVTEPARATATAIAARFGLAKNVEEAGNRVERVEIDELRETLERHGFQIVNADRYAMVYRHEPGPLMRALSLRFTFAFAKAGFRLVNAVMGRGGNKAVVVGVRVG